MANFALLDVDLFANGLDLSCFTNQLEVMTEATTLDATTFCSGGWDTPIAGRRTTSITASGPTDMATATAAQTSAVDEVLAVDLGGTYTLSAVPMGSSAGAVGYFTQGVLFSRQVLGGTVGDLATHSVSFKGSTPMIRGAVLTAADVTATGTSAVQQLGAVTASQRIWCALHVLAVSGTSTPTITVKIQSAAASGFASPTDRITLTAATAKGAQFSSTLGAITDTYWRASYTVSGTNPVLTVRILAGIY